MCGLCPLAYLLTINYQCFPLSKLSHFCHYTDAIAARGTRNRLCEEGSEFNRVSEKRTAKSSQSLAHRTKAILDLVRKTEP
jgi:hypothetical protein